MHDLSARDGAAVIVVGTTTSLDFPTASSAPDSTLDGKTGIDGFVSVLTTTGALVKSTYLGGDEFDEVARVGVDSDGDPVVAGKTYGTVPIKDAYQTTPSEVFLSKYFHASGGLRWSTYLGKTGSVAAVFSTDAGLAVVGHTDRDFPVTEGSGTTTTQRGFFSLFDATGKVTRSFLFGGTGKEVVSDATSVGSSIYVTGVTQSTDFPGLSGKTGPYVAKLTGPSAVAWAKPLAVESLPQRHRFEAPVSAGTCSLHTTCRRALRVLREVSPHHWQTAPPWPCVAGGPMGPSAGPLASAATEWPAACL